MKDASQYPVTFGFGGIDGYYYGPNGIIGPYHEGDDRAMSIGVPVIVNGQEIGKSGNSGKVGPHLHVGRYVNGRAVNPFGGGFQLPAPVTVYDTDAVDDSADGKNIRLRDGQGVIWLYDHLSEIKVAKGQIIGAGENEVATKEQLIVEYGLAFPNQPVNYDWVNANIGKDWSDVVNSLRDDPSRQAYITKLVNDAAAYENQPKQFKKIDHPVYEEVQ